MQWDFGPIDYLYEVRVACKDDRPRLLGCLAEAIQREPNQPAICGRAHGRDARDDSDNSWRTRGATGRARVVCLKWPTSASAAATGGRAGQPARAGFRRR